MNPLDWLRLARGNAAICRPPPVPPEPNPRKPLEKSPIPPEAPCSSLYVKEKQTNSVTADEQEELYFGDEGVQGSGCDRGNQENIETIEMLSVRVAQGETAKSEPVRAEEPRIPYFTADGTLRIPFDCDPKYHWWKGGQSVKKTIAELRGEVLEEPPAKDVPSDCNY
jgi:hypothetical protein